MPRLGRARELAQNAIDSIAKRSIRRTTRTPLPRPEIQSDAAVEGSKVERRKRRVIGDSDCLLALGRERSRGRDLVRSQSESQALSGLCDRQLQYADIGLLNFETILVITSKRWQPTKV